MSCGCIKKRDFDIDISFKGCETLVIEDQSVWSTGPGYTKPDSYTITINIPSRGSTVDLEIKTNSKNYFTSKDLFNSIDIQCLPDDIYCFTTTSCGNKLTITRAILCNTEIKLDELISKFSDELDPDKRQLIFEISSGIEAIKINSKKGNLETSKKLLKRLNKKLESFNCEHC